MRLEGFPGDTGLGQNPSGHGMAGGDLPAAGVVDQTLDEPLIGSSRFNLECELLRVARVSD